MPATRFFASPLWKLPVSNLAFVGSATRFEILKLPPFEKIGPIRGRVRILDKLHVIALRIQ
jgi:hypothetical protein